MTKKKIYTEPTCTFYMCAADIITSSTVGEDFYEPEKNPWDEVGYF